MNRTPRGNVRYKKQKSNLPLLLMIVLAAALIVLLVALLKPKNEKTGDETTVDRQNTTAVTTVPEDTTTAVTTDTETSDGIVVTESDAVTTETDEIVITDPVVTTSPVTTVPVTVPPVTDATDTTAQTTGAPVTEAPSNDPADIYPGTPATYANQVPASAAVGNDFFSDALFIGDSRTVGFQMSTQLSATFYAKVSLNIGQLKKTDDASRFLNIKTSSGTVKCNVYEALTYQTNFTKVYLAMGLSELGWNENSFFNTYKETVAYIRNKLPNATIYIETIIPVSAERSNKNIYGVTNAAVWRFNEKLSALAAENGCKLVNVAEQFTTKEGTLPGSYAPDGVHMSSEHYVEWLDYLRAHT